MRKYLLVLTIWASVSHLACAQYKSWGVGLQVGDPLGVSIKKYLTKHTAIEANGGYSGLWGYNYRRAFYRHAPYNREQYAYRQHRLHSSVSFQLHYLVQQPITKGRFRGIEWFWGVGSQFRSFSVDYEYRYYAQGLQGDESVVQDKRLPYLGLGIDGTTGIEYSWREVPFSVFANATLFMEIIQTPLLFYIQSGIGGRYYF